MTSSCPSRTTSLRRLHSLIPLDVLFANWAVVPGVPPLASLTLLNIRVPDLHETAVAIAATKRAELVAPPPLDEFLSYFMHMPTLEHPRRSQAATPDLLEYKQIKHPRLSALASRPTIATTPKAAELASAAAAIR
jgi:hypothetical protein